MDVLYHPNSKNSTVFWNVRNIQHLRPTFVTIVESGGESSRYPPAVAWVDATFAPLESTSERIFCRRAKGQGGGTPHSFVEQACAHYERLYAGVFYQRFVLEQ